MADGEQRASLQSKSVAPADPRAEDRRADIHSLFWLGGFLILAQIINVWAYATEFSRSALGDGPAKVTLYEFSSLVVILALMPLGIASVSRAMPGQHSWARVWIVHGAVLLAFSFLHTAGFVILRKLFYPVFFDGGQYIFTDNPGREFFYEFRKDVLLYAVIIIVIVSGRQFAQARRELADARAEASQRQQLTIKTGGRVLYLQAEDILWVRAAGNYVDIRTADRTMVIRSTLAAIADQIDAAGGQCERVHRSWLLNPGALRELRGTGSGDAVAVLENGEEVPVSRRYRGQLAAVSLQ